MTKAPEEIIKGQKMEEVTNPIDDVSCSFIKQFIAKSVKRGVVEDGSPLSQKINWFPIGQGG